MDTNIQQTYFLSIAQGKKKRLEVLYHVSGKTDRLHEKIYPQEGVEIKR